ncbi:DUF3971 domain-containing protein [Pseudooctadecabacter sp.]|uniref:YhdP family protein n=1 Tax=Pseudooctadecabacter sp. TaxID=1966338 RepID=UPI0035C87E24
MNDIRPDNEAPQQAPEQSPAPASVPASGQASGRPRRRIWLWLRAGLLVLAAPVLMAMIAAVLLIGREVTAPSWIVRDVEARAAEVLGGGSLGFGELKVTVGTDLHPRLVLRNAVLRDADGAKIAEVPRIEGLVSPRGILQGRLLAQRVDLRGAQISVRRSKDGTVAFAFDQSGQNIAAADGFLGLLDLVDQTFEAAALEALEEVRATGLIINYSDARAGRSWVVDGGRIGLDLRGDALALRADIALLSGRSFVTTAELTYDSLRGSRTAELGVTITDAAAPDIASQAPVLAFLGVLDAPISGAMRSRLDEDGALASLSATLQIGEGELQPNSATRPIPFKSAQTYLTYDPLAEALTFDLIEIDSALGRVAGTAQTHLRDYRNGWPASLLGQIELTDVAVEESEFFPQSVVVPHANVGFRLNLTPFTLDIGEAVIQTGGAEAPVPLSVSGQVRAGADGWSVALDVAADEVETRDVLSLWPEGAAPGTRGWLDDNIQQGVLRDVAVAYRGAADAPTVFAMTMEYVDATVGFMRTMPPIENARGTMSLVDGRYALTVDEGHVAAPQGGRINMAGSTMVIPKTGQRAPAVFDLSLSGRLTAMMAILRLPPFNVLADSDLPVSFAQGQAQVDVLIETPLGRDVAPDERTWQATASLRNLRSEVLVPGQVLTASTAEVRVDADSLVVRGPARVGEVAGRATFSRALGAGSQGTSRLEAEVTIGPDFLRTFNITLPRGMVTGEGPARLTLDLADPARPDFTLTSDLRGIGLNLPSVGYAKARGASGNLRVTGHLGDSPSIDRLSISAPGLETDGRVTLSPGGGLARAAFDRVRLGGWLDAPVVLIGRGPGRAAEVQVAGGSLDLRSARFGGQGGGGGGNGGPLDVALDRLRVTDAIYLDNFRGQFTSAGGLQGTFEGLVNGGAPVSGTMVPANGGSAVRIQSGDAGALLRATGLLRGALGGRMEMTLVPTGAEGTYDGVVAGRDLRVRDAPALASLLDAVSIVGLLTQLDGQGLMFSDVDAQFRLTPDRVILTQSSAVGPSIGLSLDGFINQGAGTIDLQGVVSPVYLLNGLGAVLTRRGEGLIGFNFNLTGAVDSPQVSVNPLSALTPGMFREIFRRPPPQVGQ